MAYIVMAYIVLVFVGMVYIVMAYIVMVYAGMVYIVMACRHWFLLPHLDAEPTMT